MTEDDNGQAVRNHWRASIDGHAVSLVSMKRLTFLVCKFIGGLGSRIDTRSSIDFFFCAKFVDRDDWSNNSAVFLVWNAIILRHLKERDAWIFRNAIIIKDKLILIVYVGGIVTLQVSLTQWRYIHHFSLFFFSSAFFSSELIFKVSLNRAYPCGSYIPKSYLPSIFLQEVSLSTFL